ncbi:MAG: sulfatase-like hydrolase/transferase, partial [Planctomycetota bacterium]
YYFQSARHVDQGVENAVKWLDKYGEHPFFFFFHTYDIHRYEPPEAYRNKFVAPGEHRLSSTEELARKIQSYDNRAFVESLDSADLQYIIDLYDASICWVDCYVSDLLGYLEKRGLLSRTIVVLTSDHGEEFLERSRTGHGYSNFEEQIRVPLLIYHPDVKPGSRATLFRQIDLLPTLAEALGLQPRREWLGESLWPTVTAGDDPGASNRTLNYCECGHSDYRSLESLQWKLIDNKAPKKVLLFNLKEDPGERKDVADDHPQVKRTMEHLLDQIESLNRKLSPRFTGESIGMDELPDELLKQLKEFGYTK